MRFAEFIQMDGLGRTAAKLINHEDLTIAFIGGSVTVGACASDEESTSYRALISKYFMDTFPKTKLRFQNAAIGGTDSVGNGWEIGRRTKPAIGHRRGTSFISILKGRQSSFPCWRAWKRETWK